MPKKINISDVEKQLPHFVKIIPESYRGIRYSADFVDTEYNENFTAHVFSVIKLQHGCKSRSNTMRSETNQKLFKGKNGIDLRIPIEEIIVKLPSFLEIEENSYTGVRNKAKFYDTEYDIHFEATPANMIRGKGFCNERNLQETKKAWTLTPQEIQLRINNIYDGRIVLVEDTYETTAKVCSWEIDNYKVIKANPSAMLNGGYFDRKEREKWRARVLVRDNFTCQKCGIEEDYTAHHIQPWISHKNLRFEVNNGICLCQFCHNLYHSIYKSNENPETFSVFMDHPEPELLKWQDPTLDDSEPKFKIISPEGEAFQAHTVTRLSEFIGQTQGNVRQVLLGLRAHVNGYHLDNMSAEHRKHYSNYLQRLSNPESEKVKN